MPKRGLGSLEGSAVDPEDTEEEKQRRMQESLYRAQETGSDYGAGFHVGSHFMGSDGWLYRKGQNGNVKVKYMGTRSRR